MGTGAGRGFECGTNKSWIQYIVPPIERLEGGGRGQTNYKGIQDGTMRDAYFTLANASR